MEPTFTHSPLRPAPPAAAERRTEILGARVYSDQRIKLTQEYKGNVSALFRFLLDLYLNDKLPEVRAEFEALVAEQNKI